MYPGESIIISIPRLYFLNVKRYYNPIYFYYIITTLDQILHFRQEGCASMPSR